MYVELTPQDTLRDLQTLLLDSLQDFEFPRCNLNDYTIDTQIKPRSEVVEGDFVLGTVWHDLTEIINQAEEQEEEVLVENSAFNFELTAEEMNIIALLMLVNWTQRQVASIENTRMKYSGTDFKLTSQANHLQKLLSLLSECQRQSLHAQRLYKRRRLIQDTGTQYDGFYRSNWDVFGSGVYYDRYKN